MTAPACKGTFHVAVYTGKLSLLNSYLICIMQQVILDGMVPVVEDKGRNSSSHDIVVALWTAGQQIKQSILHLGNDSYQNSSH